MNVSQSPGYWDNDHQCEDIDECEKFQKQGLQGCEEKISNFALSSCSNTPGGYDCDCKSGFTLMNNKSQQLISTTKNCSNQDECQLGSHQCSVNSKCHDTFGSYRQRLI